MSHGIIPSFLKEEQSLDNSKSSKILDDEYVIVKSQHLMDLDLTALRTLLKGFQFQKYY